MKCVYLSHASQLLQCLKHKSVSPQCFFSFFRQSDLCFWHAYSAYRPTIVYNNIHSVRATNELARATSYANR